MNPFVSPLCFDDITYSFVPVSQVEGADDLPFSLKVLVENVLRNARTPEEGMAAAQRIVAAGKARATGEEIEFRPARVLFQDFTGVPAFVDYAVMREACADLGGNPDAINPQVPCNLVIDHSVIADDYGCEQACAANMELEATRNAERYSFLKWSQGSFKNVEITPPGEGICHQLNIERFAKVVMSQKLATEDETPFTAGLAYFDTLVGTDSHTPTANGLGILGWGVGGIEAEAASLGQSITTLVPRVVGVRLTGQLGSGVTGMDLALTFAQLLRAAGVVGAFVECFGPGVSGLTATQRTCVSNMSPEYGCTSTLFPVDEQTIAYLRLTGRSARLCRLVEEYARNQGVWGTHDDASRYAEVLDLDLSQVQPSIAGPSRPHDRIPAAEARARFREICASRSLDFGTTVDVAGTVLTHGTIAIAAVTSCTTATDPAMMVAAGLLAKNAAAAGLAAKPWVKTILAPGSHAAADILARAGLMEGLQACGFFTCGFGCMSCIGNSGPLSGAMHEAAATLELASVLSGNRNFEGRISPDVSQNYLMAPARVVAYALAGTMDIDFATDALGVRADGTPVMLADIWPDEAQVAQLVAEYVTPDLYGGQAATDAAWDAIAVEPSDTFAWDAASTYVRRAPYFEGLTATPAPVAAIRDARVLALLGDFITTDHISPAGSIATKSPAADYLRAAGVPEDLFNTYGSRRGNHEVMMRGTFANVKLQNQMTPHLKGGWTKDFAAVDDITAVADAPDAYIFDAAMHYAQAGTPTVLIAGKMYGSGSSRDWAAKGPALLGVRAAIAQSFERIHRSNLVGMGILPLQFDEGQDAASLGLTGAERITVTLPEGSLVGARATVTAQRPDGEVVTFGCLIRIDTPTEAQYYAHGGILPYVVRGLA